MSGMIASCRVKVNSAGDWQILPPAGQITQIGDATTTAWGLVADDDLMVTGNAEVGGGMYIRGQSWLLGELGLKQGLQIYSGGGGVLSKAYVMEEVTIPVGQGAGGVLSSADLCPANSVLLGIAGRVNQAPGGGASLLNVGRAGNIDEFADDIAVALGTQFTSPTDGDGDNPGPVFNAADTKMTLTTDANVTGTDMKVRIVVFYVELIAPTS